MSTTSPGNGTAIRVQEILGILASVRRHATMVWWATTVLGVLGAFALLLLVAVLLDQWLVLPGAIRLVLLLLVLAGPIFVLRRAWKSKPGGTDEDMALVVERRYPDLDNALINSLQLAESHPDEAEAIVDAITQDARVSLDSVRPTAAVPKRDLSYAGAATAVALLILVAYAAINLPGLSNGLNRVLAPLGDNTYTRILEVAPGSSDVLLGSDVAITAQVGGRVPRSGKLVVRTADGRKNSIVMDPSPAAPDKLVGTLEKVEQDARYYVSAGDDESEQYELRIHPPPKVNQVVQAVTPPEYITAPPVEQMTGDIQALPGSKVALKIQTTEPLRSAKLVLSDSRTVEMKIAPPPAGASGSVGTAEFFVNKAGEYRVELVSTYGFPGEPATYAIGMLEDKAPLVEIAQPNAEISVDIDAKVAVAVDASDDYGLKAVRLVRIEQASADSGGEATQGQKLTTMTEWSAPDKTKAQGKLSHPHSVNVAELGLSDTNPIVLQALAYDFKPDREPASSGLVTIRLKAPPGETGRLNAAMARVSLDALIAKQRANIAASEEALKNGDSGEKLSAIVSRQEDIRTDALAIAGAHGKGNTSPSPSESASARERVGESSKPGEGASGQEGPEKKDDPANSTAPSPGPKTGHPLPDAKTLGEGSVPSKLIDLANTLMTLAIEQLRTAAAANDAKPGLSRAIDTEKAILAALVIADARQDEELNERAQREIAELLAELLARQTTLKTDTKGAPGIQESGNALAARQSSLARDASRLQKAVGAQALTGANGNAELATAYENIAQGMESKAVRANMLVAAERLGAEARDEAIAKQDLVIAALIELQKMLRGPALAEAEEEVKDALDGLQEAKEKVDKLEKLQTQITEVAKALQKTKDLSEGKEMPEEELKDLEEARAQVKEVIEQLIKDMHLIPDMSASNDLLAELSEVFEKVKQDPGSENAAVGEVAVDRDEGILAALKAMQKQMGERIGDLEMWLSDKPDSTRWKQESFDRDEMGKIPLGDLPDALEDIIGDMLDQNEELSKEAEDSVSNAGLPDGEMGWDIMDGPQPSWAAKGKSGNEKPNSNEQTGRSGSGRQGKSSGEIAGDTVKNLAGAEVEARRTNDGFQAGELKEEPGSEMDVKATGGGKLAGVSDNEGMTGDAPARDELKYRDMARRAQQMKRDAETVYSKAKLLKLPTGELDKAILEMDAASRRLEAGDIEGFARAQDAVARALKETQAKLQGKQAVEMARDTKKQDPNAVGATNEPVPKQYEDAVAQYMREIAKP